MKTYVKPVLYYETFELTHHVAACTVDMNSSINDCKVGTLVQDNFTYILFDAGMDGCKLYDGISELYCYTNSGLNVTNIGFGS